MLWAIYRGPVPSSRNIDSVDDNDSITIQTISESEDDDEGFFVGQDHLIT